MSYTASCTVTGKTGPGNTVTAVALADVKEITFDIAKAVVRIKYGANKVFESDYAVTVTVTDTISGTVSTFAMST